MRGRKLPGRARPDRNISTRRLFTLLSAAMALGLVASSCGASQPVPEPEASELPGEDKLEANALPAGFQDEIVLEIQEPTGFEFTPDGRMIITSQPGQLFVWNGRTTITALDLVAVTCSRIEQGMLGIAADPDFATNRFIYVYYTFDDEGECVNRVSRFTLADESRVDPSTEKVLIDKILSVRAYHNGGGLEFGKDGYLYVGVGDSGCDYDGGGCDGRNDASRDLHALVGKILRITKDGGIPPDNPFLGPDSVECRLSGVAAPGKVCEETYLWGLRNPFRFAFDPHAEPARLYVNDVGQFVWEEINLAVPGADYGWNVREGRCANNSEEDCDGPPEGMTDPIFSYSHERNRPGDCAAITGGAFVPEGLWPEPYSGAYLFSDYRCGAIFRLVEDEAGEFSRTAFAVDLGVGSASDIGFGPFGDTQALYYASYEGGGRIARISYGGEPSS